MEHPPIRTLHTTMGEMLAVRVTIRERGHRPTLDESLAFHDVGYWDAGADDVATLTYPFLYRIEVVDEEAQENADLIPGTRGNPEAIRAVADYYGHLHMVWTPFGLVVFDVRR